MIDVGAHDAASRLLLGLAMAVGGAGACRGNPVPEWLTEPPVSHVRLSADGERLAWARGEHLYLAPVDSELLSEEGPAPLLGTVRFTRGRTSTSKVRGAFRTRDPSEGLSYAAGGWIGGLWWVGERLMIEVLSADRERIVLVSPDLGAGRELAALPRGGHSRIDVIHVAESSILLVRDERTPFQPDVYAIDPDSGEERIAEYNPGRVMRWAADADGRVRAAQRWHPAAAGVRYEWMYKTGSHWRALHSFELGDAEERLLRVGDRGLLLAATTAGGPSLRWLDPLTRGFGEPLWQGKAGTIIGVVDAIGGGPPGLVAVQSERSELVPVGDEWPRRLGALLDAHPGSSPQLVGRSAGDRRLLWRVGSDRDPGRYVLQTGADRFATVLQVHETADPRRMHPKRAFSFQARDGLTLHGYATLPPTEGRSPAVVLVHGGPWARDGWDFDGEAQFLAGLGYAVLQVNFRGSNGLGQALFDAGRRQWGKGMQNDLVDAVRFADRRQWIDPHRVCVMGASYGAYAALMGVIENPETFRCAVSRAPVADLDAHVETIRAGGNRRGYLEWRELVGPPGALRHVSPRFRADRIDRPVLLVHGEADRVVPIEQSRALVAAAGEAIRWMSLPGAGHLIRDPETLRLYYAAVAEFLRSALGRDS